MDFNSSFLLALHLIAFDLEMRVTFLVDSAWTKGTFSVQPGSYWSRQSNGRSNLEVVGSIPKEKNYFFFTLCGSLIPFTRANTQWVFHGFHIAL